MTQNTSGNEGYLPTTYSKAYKTTDKGDVQALVTGDVWGASSAPDGVDIIAGTKSPTAGQGTIEIWGSKNSSPADYQQKEVYPILGSIPSNNLGEVNSMALADLDADGLKDLVVGTTTSAGFYSGQLLVFQNKGKSSGSNRFQCKNVYTLPADRALTVTVLDVDGDGRPDIVVGTQSGAGSGNLLWFRNGGSCNFTLTETVIAPGIVTALASGDLGGIGRSDIVMGWRRATSDYAGGVQIYYTDAGIVPLTGTDPSAGSIVNFVPALVLGNFNYGIYPTTPSPPYNLDIAAGVKQSASTGSIVVLIR
jgi:hypothetical protein